ncbi:MAG: hypothetical protein ACP5G1_01005 [Nanopusillaceae archaeon]
MSETLEDRWSVDVEESFDVDSLKYEKKFIIKIKNHSPYVRRFEVGTKYAYFKDQATSLRFRLYYNLITPVLISIDKYRKENIEVLIPKANYSVGDYILIYVKNLDKKEEMDVKLYV